jgi:hypothetical protein
LSNEEEDTTINQTRINRERLKQKLWEILFELRCHWENRTEYIDFQFTDKEHFLFQPLGITTFQVR